MSIHRGQLIDKKSAQIQMLCPRIFFYLQKNRRQAPHHRVEQYCKIPVVHLAVGPYDPVEDAYLPFILYGP